MRKFLLISFLCITSTSYSQNEHKLDSLYSIWKDESQKDSLRIISYHRYIWNGYMGYDLDSTLVLSDELLKFVKTKNLNWAIANTYFLRAEANRRLDNYEEALKLFNKSLSYRDSITQQRQIAFTYGQISLLYKDKSDYFKALKFEEKCLVISRDINDIGSISVSLNNIGVIYELQGLYNQALDKYKSALKIRQDLGRKNWLATSYNNIASIYAKTGEYEKSVEYLNEVIKLRDGENDKIELCLNYQNLSNAFVNLKLFDSSFYYINKAIKLADESGSKRDLAYAFMGKGKIYDAINDYDNAKFQYNEGAILFQDLGIKDNLDLTQLKWSVGDLELRKKNYVTSLKNCLSAYNMAKKIGAIKELSMSCACLYESYKSIGNAEKALVYHEELMALNDSLKPIETAKKLQKMEFEKQVLTDSLQHVEKELIVEIAHQKEKTNLTVAWGSSLSAMSILAFLVFRNVKRKQRKAEEERQKQIEEKEKILKNLELQTIDAMIAGQEKERQRLAADLHDSVGATLAAAKLQFDHLIKDEIDNKIRGQLINKTSTLLEDAYVEIRSMAHLKNSGVIAKNGLLPAVKNLTNNASGINGLSFEVQSFGLEQRLDNSLEISIFRIIQELVTNIIKHANATKGIVYLTNHDSNLNVMIEDNGKGFNPKQIETGKSGMGISSIDKRVEHLDGKLSIESELNKGTTVIIDIPL